eukprot:ctg_573.g267
MRYPEEKYPPTEHDPSLAETCNKGATRRSPAAVLTHDRARAPLPSTDACTATFIRDARQSRIVAESVRSPCRALRIRRRSGAVHP